MTIKPIKLLFLAATILIIGRLWPSIWIFSELNLNVPTDYTLLTKVLPPKIKPTAVLDGLSHPNHRGKLLVELLFHPRTIIHGHALSSKHRDVGESMSQIASVLSNHDSFQMWGGGGKNCGGFHADYYLSWNTSTGAHEALLCLGCYEVLLYGKDASLRCDLAYPARKRIEAALKKLEPTNQP